MILEVKNWQEEVQLAALKFVDESMNAFQRSLDASALRTPLVGMDGHNRPLRRKEDKMVVLNTYLDALVGMTAMIAASYCSGLDSQFEERIVTEFRRKFFELRKRVLGHEPEMTKIPIHTEKPN